ncbi:condensin complex subunit 2 isoform X2 [Tachyglossus aculeatus]|uniref:condensin complex subunit 2 isoform X2 n=1 Tax=Tachyglossus aculeatus TaxID=9261 RepID=UPI0018F5663D|nr:condensin complex subunit 2 isoform X2 [Tachyglossus aculeatus]
MGPPRSGTRTTPHTCKEDKKRFQDTQKPAAPSTPPSPGTSGGGTTPPDGTFASPRIRHPALSVSNARDLRSFLQNDDEQERKQRRRSRVVDLRLSSTDSPGSSASPAARRAETPTATVPKLTNTQISEHYSTCIKLSTENKITTKNAFGLHLIDYMTEILKQKDSELTNFKVAAGTLDASTKIYAVRVDAVHADVYRVLGGLGRDPPAADGAGGPGTDGTPVESGTAKKVQKPKKKHSSKTIEQNLNNLNLSEADRKCEIDPMFQKMAASFDECSTAGVFLSALHCHDYRSELLFDSDVRPLSASDPPGVPDSGSVEAEDLRTALLHCANGSQICPSLAGFQFTKWDSETHNESVSALLDKFKKSDQVFDVDAEVDDSDPEGYVGAPGEDDFDADAAEQTMAGDHGAFRSQEACVYRSPRKDVIPLGDGDIGTLCLHLSLKPGEYSYFSPRIMSMWAGPDHWRFKPRHKPEQNARENKKKSAKKTFELNFEEDIGFDVYFRKTKVATTLSKGTLENQNQKATTLPADFHYEPDNIIQLNLKPGNRLRKMVMQSASSEHEEEDVGDYDYDNPNDASNFCPALQAADSENDEPDGCADPSGPFDRTARPSCGQENGQENGGHADGNGADIVTYGELNLVAEPQKVNKIEIHYAKTAKKMDMKRLKQSMWSLLTKTQKNPAAKESEGIEREEELAVAGEKVFSGITKDLKHNLPSVMAQNLSVPLAFACLLHLANEKNLKLEGVEDLSDVRVMQGD